MNYPSQTVAVSCFRISLVVILVKSTKNFHKGLLALTFFFSFVPFFLLFLGGNKKKTAVLLLSFYEPSDLTE